MLNYKLARIWCTSFGLGHISKFPGTLASFLTIIFVFAVITYTSYIFFFSIFLAYSICSFFFIKIYISKKKEKDPKEVVTDEHVGQCIPLLYCQASYEQFIIAFLIFRFFDILKPFPVSYFDEMKNEFGVLFDDVAAGSLTLLLFILFDVLSFS